MNCDFYTRSQWRNLNWCHMRPFGRICQRFRDVLLMQAMLYFCWQAEKIACDKYIDYDVLNQWSASKATPRCASVSCQLSLFRHSESERSRHAVKQHLLGKYWTYSTGLTDFSVVFFLLHLAPFRSDPITCAWSQHGLGLRLDLLGQPLRGQHRLAAADDPESQGGTDPPAHSLPSFTRCN